MIMAFTTYCTYSTSCSTHWHASALPMPRDLRSGITFYYEYHVICLVPFRLSPFLNYLC